MRIFDSVLQWILDNKITTLLSILTFSFVIATIAVAVEKANVSDELGMCETMLNLVSTTSSTTEDATTDESSTEESTTEESTTEESTTTFKPPIGQVYFWLNNSFDIRIFMILRFFLYKKIQTYYFANIQTFKKHQCDTLTYFFKCHKFNHLNNEPSRLNALKTKWISLSENDANAFWNTLYLSISPKLITIENHKANFSLSYHCSENRSR